MANRSSVIARTRQAARTLNAALEEARAANAEFISLGGNTWTDPFFYVNEDVNGTLRTDLDITKDDLVNAQIALDFVESSAVNHRAFLHKVK